MLYETFRGDKNGMQDAIQRGDVRVPMFLISGIRNWYYLLSASLSQLTTNIPSAYTPPNKFARMQIPSVTLHSQLLHQHMYPERLHQQHWDSLGPSKSIAYEAQLGHDPLGLCQKIIISTKMFIGPPEGDTSLGVGGGGCGVSPSLSLSPSILPPSIPSFFHLPFSFYLCLSLSLSLS